MGKRAKKNSGEGREPEAGTARPSRREYEAEQQKREALLDRMGITDPEERKLYARASSSELDPTVVLAEPDPAAQVRLALALVDENKRRIDRMAHTFVPERTKVRSTMRVGSEAMKNIVKDRSEVLKTLLMLGKIRASLEAELAQNLLLTNEYLVHLAGLTKREGAAMQATGSGPAALARLLEMHGLLKDMAGASGAKLMDDLTEFLEERGRKRRVDCEVQDAVLERVQESLYEQREHANAWSKDANNRPTEPPSNDADEANSESEEHSDSGVVEPPRTRASETDEAQVETSGDQITDSGELPEEVVETHGNEGTSGSPEPGKSQTGGGPPSDPTVSENTANDEANSSGTASSDDHDRKIKRRRLLEDMDAASSVYLRAEKYLAKHPSDGVEAQDCAEEDAVEPSSSDPIDNTAGELGRSENGWFESEFARGTASPARPAIPARIDERDPIKEETLMIIEGGISNPDLWLKPDLGKSGLRMVQRVGPSPLLPSYRQEFLPEAATFSALASTIDNDPKFVERFNWWDGEFTAELARLAIAAQDMADTTEVENIVRKSVEKSIKTARMFVSDLPVDAQQIETLMRYWIVLLIGPGRPEHVAMWGPGYFVGVHGHDPGLGDEGYLQITL